MGGIHPAAFRARIALAAFPRNSAISAGPSENSPALAFSVSVRRYPPALLISSPRCRIAAMTIDASCSPKTSKASAQASGETPSAERAVAAALAKSRHEEISPALA